MVPVAMSILLMNNVPTTPHRGHATAVVALLDVRRGQRLIKDMVVTTLLFVTGVAVLRHRRVVVGVEEPLAMTVIKSTVDPD